MKKVLSMATVLVLSFGLSGCIGEDDVYSSVVSTGACVADGGTYVVIANNYPQDSCQLLISGGSYDSFYYSNKSCSTDYPSVTNCTEVDFNYLY